MTLTEILATPRKILYVNNSGVDLAMFEDALRAAIYADSTVLPEEIADLLRLEYVQIGAERRAIVWAA